MGSFNITVDVSLCGSVPRSHMELHAQKNDHKMRNAGKTFPFSKQAQMKSCILTDTACCQSKLSNKRPSYPVTRLNNNHLNNSIASESHHSKVTSVEPPLWAVCAKGDAKLQPIFANSDTNNQGIINLADRPFYRIGRAPTSDILLLHDTSSRRHAILFHHPNGTCYVLDCGSAQGTFINGVRVSHHVKQDGIGSTQRVSPQRVKKGAIIRFGGDGAPSFILKSFAAGFDTLLQDVNTKSLSRLRDSSTPNSKVANAELSCEALLSLNTRINAIGKITGMYHQCNSLSYLFLKKRCKMSRSADPEITCKKMRLLPPQISLPLDAGLTNSSLAAMSPTRIWTKNQVHVLKLMSQPIVSPDTDACDHIITPLQIPSLHPICKQSQRPEISIPFNKLLRRKKSKKQVSFSDEDPILLYPRSVTPDTSSDEEENIMIGLWNNYPRHHCLIEPCTSKVVASVN